MLKFFPEHRCKHPKQDNTSEVYSRNARLVKHWCINQYTLPLLSNKEENHMINSVDAKTLFDKIQHPFSIKTFEKLGIERIILNLIEGV